MNFLNFVPAAGKNVSAMFGTLAILLLCFLSPTPSAAQAVDVYPAAQIQGPYQVTEAIGDSTACAPQCILKFPAVPSGKRLVITNVSAQLGLSNDSFVIEGNGGAFFLQKPYQTAEYLDALVTVYFEPSSIPTARFFVQDITQHTSLIVTFAGYFVPFQ
jgi:hypothetical protein